MSDTGYRLLLEQYDRAIAEARRVGLRWLVRMTLQRRDAIAREWAEALVARVPEVEA